MDNIQKRLKMARNAKNMTQKEIAEILGVTQQAYQKFERENPPDMRVSTLLKICRTLDISADWLIGADEKATATKGMRKATKTNRPRLKAAKPNPMKRGE